jgi:hypothetical protein
MKVQAASRCPEPRATLWSKMYPWGLALAPALRVGQGATVVAAMEQGSVEAAIMLDPAITQLQGRNKDLRILTDTRTQKDTLDVFGGEYPGGHALPRVLEHI